MYFLYGMRSVDCVDFVSIPNCEIIE
jgi:hypothetical protein